MSTLYFLTTGNVPPDARSWPGQAAPTFEPLFLAHSTQMSEVYGHPTSAVAFLDKNPVPGTKRLPSPKRLGSFSVGGEWEVDLFDSYYDVKHA